MARNSLLILFLFFSVMLRADELKQAKEYLEADNYDKAIEIYESQRKGSLKPWQRDVLAYNIGCVRMAQGEWKMAADQFNAIELGDDPNPLLEMSVRKNQAISYMKLAAMLTSEEDAEEKYVYLIEASEAVKEALEAECRLQQAEGAKACAASDDLAKMDRELAEKIRNTPFGSEDEKIKEAKSPADVLSNLLILQRAALKLNRQIQKMGGGTAEEAQKQVVEQAAAFYPMAATASQTEFRSLATASLTDRCQAHPWDEVVPLFEKGVEAARSALTLSGKKAMRRQVDAYFSWKKALKALQKPKSEYHGGCKGAQQELKKPEEQEEQMATETRPSLDETIKNLQEMDQLDSSPVVTTPVQVKGVRPW